MLPCPKCGYDNQLGRVFCHSCGAKLDLSQIKAPGQGGKSLKRKTWTTGRIMRRVLDVALFALIAWGIYLLIQVPEMDFPKATDKDLVSADKKRIEFESIPDKYNPGTIEITESDLNTFLSSLHFEKSKGQLFGVSPEKLYIALGEGTATLTFQGTLNLGPLEKQVAFTYSGTPVVGGGRFVFKPGGGWIGKLPLHPSLLSSTGLMSGYFGQIFSKLDHERDILSRLSAITITPKKAVLNYPSAGAQKK